MVSPLVAHWLTEIQNHTETHEDTCTESNLPSSHCSLPLQQALAKEIRTQRTEFKTFSVLPIVASLVLHILPTAEGMSLTGAASNGS